MYRCCLFCFAPQESTDLAAVIALQTEIEKGEVMEELLAKKLRISPSNGWADGGESGGDWPVEKLILKRDVWGTRLTQ